VEEVKEEEGEEGEGEAASDVVRSAGLNYPDVLAQIRLPVYAHNAVRNVQSTAATPARCLLCLLPSSPLPSPPPSRSKEEGEGEGGVGGIRTRVSAYAVCVLSGWAHIDRYVLPVAR